MYLPGPTRSLIACVSLASTSLAQFSNPIPYEPAGFSGIDRVVAADLDGDGDQDAVATRFNALFWMENSGNATFSQAQVITTSFASPAVDVADLNGDGILDVVVGPQFGADVSWMAGFGNGLFSAPISVGTNLGVTNLLAADFDQDGDVDIATQNSLGVTMYENIGFASFLAPVGLGTIGALQSAVQAGDLDGDGYTDLYAAANTQVIAYYGSSTGLEAPVTLVTGVSVITVAAGNLNGDSILDLVYMDLATGRLVWQPGATGRTYGAAHVVESSLSFFHLTSIADVDGDGIDDILDTQSISTMPFRWYRGLGAGDFEAPRRIEGARGLDLRIVDLNGDQSLDLMSTGNDPAIWLNGMPSVVEYCQGVPNSTGNSGVIEYSGSTHVLSNNATLNAYNIPNGTFGLFLTSRTQGFAASPGGSQGNICIGGAIGRYSGTGQIVFSGGTGTFSLAISLLSLPTPTQSVVAQSGETWNFQAWHRDAVQGQTTSNFTSAVSVLVYW